MLDQKLIDQINELDKQKEGNELLIQAVELIMGLMESSKTLRKDVLQEVADYFDQKHKEKPYQAWHTDVVARHIRRMKKDLGNKDE